MFENKTRPELLIEILKIISIKEQTYSELSVPSFNYKVDNYLLEDIQNEINYYYLLVEQFSRDNTEEVKNKVISALNYYLKEKNSIDPIETQY
jgi:hypothetical protein